MRRLKTLVVLCALVMVFPLISEAKRGKGGEGPLVKMMQELDLSDEQKAQLKKVRQDNRDKARALRTQMREKREALKEAMDSNASEDKIRSLRKEVTDAQSKLADFRFEKKMAVRKILTPEQRKKFQELRSKNRELRKGRRVKGVE